MITSYNAHPICTKDSLSAIPSNKIPVPSDQILFYLQKIWSILAPILPLHDPHLIQLTDNFVRDWYVTFPKGGTVTATYMCLTCTRAVWVTVSFSNSFVSIFVVILLYCYLPMIGIFPSFIMEISQKTNRPMETTKALKGHLSF